MGFVSTFYIPLARNKLWQECFFPQGASHPLGTSPGTTQELSESADLHLRGAEAGVPPEDAVRRVHLANGHNIAYALVECHAWHVATFEILDQHGDLIFEAKAGEAPRCAAYALEFCPSAHAQRLGSS
uniref:Uncharacterized protein n=1 Tax=Haptolina brevifila TaxID=156173 RepID=A0A7S2IJA3_9EUKA|mmetsp:Transcript_66502/g.131849  ORF Transcript_66502/g.131849 Transcript_66502/m.131849 type:complete len:128 (+) Transcript_66502:44-427(+)